MDFVGYGYILHVCNDKADLNVVYSASAPTFAAPPMMMMMMAADV